MAKNICLFRLCLKQVGVYKFEFGPGRLLGQWFGSL